MSTPVRLYKEKPLIRQQARTDGLRFGTTCILRGSALALAFALAAVGAGYAWLSARWFRLSTAMTIGDQIAFALKADLLLFVWLA